MRNFRTLLPYVARHRASFISGMFIILIVSLIQLTQPYLLKVGIDSLEQKRIDVWGLLLLGLAMTGIAAMQLVLDFFRRYQINRKGHQIEAELRHDLFAKLQTLDRSYYDETSVGDLMVRSTVDMGIVRNFINTGVTAITQTFFLGTFALILMFSTNWRLALIALVAWPFIAIAFGLISRRMDVHFRSSQEQLGELSNRGQEVFGGIRVVKAYTREDTEIAAYAADNDRMIKETIAYARLSGLLMPIIMLAMGLTTATLLWMGAGEIQAGRLTIGQFVQFNAYLLLMATPLSWVGQLMNVAQQAGIALGRIREVMLHAPHITDPAADQTETLANDRSTKGAVEFENVGLRHGDKWVLRNVNFKIKPGKTVAIVGPTGSGKSSLAALLGRVYDPQEGTVRLDGVDVRSLSLHELRQQVAYVPQETLLFSLSLRENIAFGKPQVQDEDEILFQAVRNARLSQDLPQIPGGFDAIVGERGVTLSGGQKQRTAIARALLPEASVLLLDDALSSVDARTQNLIAANLKILANQGRTTLIVTQRIALVTNSDWIVVLDDGRLVDEGTHADLMARNGLYARMYRRELALSEDNFLDDDFLYTPAPSGADGDEEFIPATSSKKKAKTDETAAPAKKRRRGIFGLIQVNEPEQGGDEIVKQNYEGKRLSRLWGYVWRYKRTLAIAAPIVIIAGLLEIVGPYLNKVAIDDYIVPRKLDGFWLVLSLFFGSLLLSFLFRYLRAFIMQTVGQWVVRDLRNQLYGHLLKNSLAFHDRHAAGSLNGRLTSDMDAINDLLSTGAVAIVADVVTLIGIVTAMLLLDWRLTLVSLAVLPILGSISWSFRKVMRRIYRASRAKYSILGGYLAENYNGMLTVQLFNRQKRNFEQFDQLNDDYLRSNRKIAYANGMFMPAVTFLGTFANTLLLFVGGWLFLGSTGVTFGLLVAFFQYTERAFQPVRDLAERYNSFQAASTSCERVFGLLDQPSKVQDTDHPRPLVETGQRNWASIEFDRVTFGYTEDISVIRDMSFTVRPGEKIAVVGPTGAGKTSIVSLLGRNYEIQSGAIRINGVDIREVTQKDLRQHLALVLQDPVLFKGTIADNIRFGATDLSDEQMKWAAQQVGAAGFIESLPGGYDYELRERGSNLSAGQRQLISFARAIAYNPDAILILDEATSSVDTESEAVIQTALQTLLQNRTAIIIAHRLSTIKDVDRVFVIERGQIAEAGTQEELLAQHGLYYQLYRNQFGKQLVEL